MSKPNQRSFRYSDEVAKILHNYGDESMSMSEKFENLVLKCHKDLPELDKMLAHRREELDKVKADISQKRKDLFAFDDLISGKARLTGAITRLSLDILDYNEKLKDKM